MHALKSLLLVFLLVGLAQASEAVQYRCKMYDHQGKLGESYLRFTIEGDICSKPYAYFGKYTDLREKAFLSCQVLSSRPVDLSVKFIDVDDENGFSSETIVMSKDMLVARMLGLETWMKCEVL